MKGLLAMTTREAYHGIGADGSLLEGHFREVAGRWRFLLSDGIAREFGAVTSYSAAAVRAPLPFNIVAKGETPQVIAARTLASPSSVIIEVTPYCRVGCSTCIASSVETRIGELSVSEFRDRVRQLASDPRINAEIPVMVSGGEPTQHPEFLALVSAPEFLNLRHRMVITSGHSFADRDFARLFREQSPETELYLQYDSFDAAHIRMIRGNDFTLLHERTIANCEEFGIRYTLVCVVLRNLNDRLAAEIAARSLSMRECVGVTLQPVKLVGRNGTSGDQHLTNTFDLVELIHERVAHETGVVLAPHPANPLNWAIGYADGFQHITQSLYELGREKRVAVIWHTDRENYVLESVARNPIAFAGDDALVPLEVHYGAV